MVEIRVHDDGVGMNPETLQKVLASSFQSTKRTTGIGLGLAVVRHVAEMHDGELRVTSTEGEGSCFTLVLARRDGHTHEGAEAPASPTDSGTGRASSPEDAPAVRA